MVRILAATCGGREVEWCYAGVLHSPTTENHSLRLTPPPSHRVDGREEPDETSQARTVCTYTLHSR